MLPVIEDLVSAHLIALLGTSGIKPLAWSSSQQAHILQTAE